MAPTTVHDVPDHLLHRIFRLLDSHDAVVRAAAVCTRWRPIVASICGGNWRRHNRHNFVTCIGYYHAVDPSFSPDPKKPATAQRVRVRVAFVPASPSIDARHFSLDFVPTGPGGRPWELVDGRGSLLLLASQRRDFFPDLVVCEPISRGYVRIQPIPGMKYSRCLGAFLGWRFNCNFVNLSEFKVTCVLHDAAEGMAGGVGAVTARVYNYRAPPDRCRKNGWDMSRAACSRIRVRGAESVHYAGRAMGSIFWGVEADGTVLSHKCYTGVFSRFRLPEHVRESHHRSTFVFVDDGRRVYPSRLRVVSLMGDELRVFVNQGQHGHGGAGAGEWELERRLHLPEATRGLPGRKECYFGGTAKIVTAGMGYVVLTPAEETWLFAVDLRTMQVEREHCRNRFLGEVYPYELETPPMVHACVLPCRRRNGGICRGFCKCR